MRIVLALLATGAVCAAQTTTRVSVATSGAQGDMDSDYHSLSSDGRYVAFSSAATTLVVGDTNGSVDVFLRDRLLGTTEIVSLDSNGVLGNAQSGGVYSGAAISSDGRCVAFWSDAT